MDWLPEHVGVPAVTVTDLTPPSGTGYSSETLLFTTGFELDGETHERRYVARLKPDRPGVFPHGTSCLDGTAFSERATFRYKRAALDERAFPLFPPAPVDFHDEIGFPLPLT